MIKGPEEACEEEDFGGDKQDHAVPEALLDRRGVVALECSFSDDIPSSLIHREGCEEEPEDY